MSVSVDKIARNLKGNIASSIAFRGASDYIGYIELLVINFSLNERINFYEACMYAPEKVSLGNIPKEEIDKIRNYFEKKIRETRNLNLFNHCFPLTP